MLEQNDSPSAVGPESRFFRYALIFSFAFTLLHILSLPLVVSYDGYLYYKLADILGTQQCAAEWDYLRTPLFPLLLRLSFVLFGRQALAVIFLNCMLSFLGTCLLGMAVKNTGRPIAAGCAVLAISLYPGLVAYGHCLLSETGTFFFIALLIYLMLWDAPRPVYKTCSLVVALLLGYYYRPTFLYLAPLFAALSAWALWRNQRIHQIEFSWRSWLGIAAILIVPFLGAMPWSSKVEYKARQAQVYYYGAAKQALVDPADPALGPFAGEYVESIHQSMYDGRLDVSGLANGREYRLVEQLDATYRGQSAPKTFLKMVWRSPQRYAAGVVRSMLLFSGFPTMGNDNAIFTELAIRHVDGATFISGPSNLQPTVENLFARKTAPSLASRLLKLLIPVYNLALFFACLLTFAGLAMALWHREWIILVLTATPIAFFLFHALILMSVDRLVMPVYPVMLFNLVVLPGWLNELRTRRSNGVPAVSVDSPAAVPTRTKEPIPGYRHTFFIFLGALLILVAAHLYYFALSRSVPSSDEAHYMSGVLKITDGFQTGGISGAWRGYLDALIFKTQFICLPAAFIMLLTGKLFASCYASLVVCFVAIGLAAYSLFRNIFSPAWSAVGSMLLLTMPLVNGLTHRFYVENYMLLFAMLLLDILIRRGGRSFLWCAVAGLVLGCGLVTKSTFALFVFLPCAYLLYEEVRMVMQDVDWPRECALLLARVGVLMAVAAGFAYPPYAAHWVEILAHIKATGSMTDCAYPEVFAFFVNVSCGPHFFIFCIALAGIPVLIDLFPNFKRREKLTWIVLLVLALVTLLATTTMLVKTTRFTSTWLPTISALAVLGLRSFTKDARRSLQIGVAAVALSTLLCLHNSFAILPIPDVKFGPLRVLSRSFPLNVPGWMNDNHPVERRDFRAPLIAAEQVIASDAAEHLKRPVSVRTTVHGMYITHDFLGLLANAQHYAVSYDWWPGADFGPAAPDYILDAIGHRALYAGSHYIEFCPNWRQDMEKAGVKYDLVAEIPEPSNAALKVYRKK